MLRVRLFAHERLPRYLKPGEVKRLLLAIDRKLPTGRRDYVTITLLLGTGLRAGEFIRLTLDDIDWRSRFLRVQRSKTGRPREVPIPDVAFRVLVDVRHDRPKDNPSRALSSATRTAGGPPRPPFLSRTRRSA